MPMAVRGLSWPARLNLLAAGRNLVYRRPRPWSWPLHMQIELTSFCELECPVCPTGLGELERAASAIDVDLFEQTLREAGPYLAHALVVGLGRAAPLQEPGARARDLLSLPDGDAPVGRTAGGNIDGAPDSREGLDTMTDWLMNPQTWIALLTLTSLEIVLGVDNVIFISILAGKLPPAQQPRARRVGLFLAMFMRIALLFSLTWIMRLTGAAVHACSATSSPGATSS